MPGRRITLGSNDCPVDPTAEKLEIAKEVGDLHVQGRGDLEQRRDRGRALGPLDLGEEAHRELGPAGHLLQGQAARLAQLTDIMCCCIKINFCPGTDDIQ